MNSMTVHAKVEFASCIKITGNATATASFSFLIALPKFLIKMSNVCGNDIRVPDCFVAVVYRPIFKPNALPVSQHAGRVRAS
ncbi:hypothetical protein [Paraburkholderia sp. J67]|uniref:hypothetical protein n=1 Tax=Paraburkholderia sp. J67 TaxID=2805435 RepID=UPI002ABD331B|nr:hypothetical protein [Paraburkholderia sp. J67]